MEEFKVSATELKAKLKAILKEGNVRRIILRNPQGRTLLDLPLAAGVAGAVFAPIWMTVATVAALATDFTVAIERDGASGPPAKP